MIRIRDAVDQPWRDLVTMLFERALFQGQVVNGSLIACFDSDNRGLIIHSALHSNCGRLVHVDAKTGEELEVLAEDPHSDIADGGAQQPIVMLDAKAKKVAAVEFDPGMPYWKCLDPTYAADFALIEKRVVGFPNVISADKADRNWIVAAQASNTPTTYYRYDRTTRALTRLFTDNPQLAKYTLAEAKVVRIPARDGFADGELPHFCRPAARARTCRSCSRSMAARGSAKRR